MAVGNQNIFSTSAIRNIYSSEVCSFGYILKAALRKLLLVFQRCYRERFKKHIFDFYIDFFIEVLQSFQPQSMFLQRLLHLSTHKVGFTFICKAHPSHFTIILGGIKSHVWSDQHLD